MSEENEKMILQESETQPVTATSTITATGPTILDVIRSISYITKGVELSQPRLLHRAIRQNVLLRHNATRELLQQTLSQLIPLSCPSLPAMKEAIQRLPVSQSSSSSSVEEFKSSSEISEIIPEVEVYLFTLIITTLLKFHLFEDAAQYSTLLIERIRQFSRRTLDLFSSKAYFYFSLSYEHIGRLESIRPILMTLYRTSCLHRDEMGEAVLLNLILRNFLHYNLIQSAHIFTSKITFPENASNNQFCRYLYSMGRIQAVQLEYSDAFLRLSMALRKAPQDIAIGFNITVQKLLIIVQLLMGDIPERALFNSSNSTYCTALKPYLYLTQAVRAGNLHQFNDVLKDHRNIFNFDKNLTLINRLGHNVLKIGLRKISVSYSRISLQDVAEKLQLSSAKAAEYVCARAIKDGVIEATIDHENGWLVSNEVVDVYGTEEPQKAFHRRIVFCLDVHNEAVKGMRYPPDAYKKEIAGGKGKEDEKSIEELIKELEDDMDDL